jgi:hypothetical protein
MSSPKTIVAIIFILAVGDIAWADGFVRGCRPARGSIFSRRILPRVLGRRGPAYACAPKSDETVWIRWKFEVGKPFYEEMITETKQEMKVMGQNISQNQKVTFFLSWNPVEQDKDDNWTVKQKIEGLKMEIAIGGNKILFDSTQKGAGANPLSDFYKALVGSEFTLTIDKNMKIAKIEGRDEFLKKLVKDNPQIEPLLKTILTDEALKQMSDPAFSVVPDKSVKKGDSWTKTAVLNMGPIGTFDTNYKYTYEGPDENKLRKIKVNITLKYNSPDPNAVGVLPFKIMKADLNSKESNGSILFDSTKGRVVSSDMTMHLAGTMTIEIGGMASDVTLVQTQTTKIKTMVENPIGKK